MRVASDLRATGALAVGDDRFALVAASCSCFHRAAESRMSRITCSMWLCLLLASDGPIAACGRLAALRAVVGAVEGQVRGRGGRGGADGAGRRLLLLGQGAHVEAVRMSNTCKVASLASCETCRG